MGPRAITRVVYDRLNRRGTRLQQGADDPDRLVGVSAGELLEWAWLTIQISDWLAHAGSATRLDFARHFDGTRDPDKTTVFLEQIGERMAALLDGDRGQP
jgi:hypothetical protein